MVLLHETRKECDETVPVHRAGNFYSIFLIPKQVWLVF